MSVRVDYGYKRKYARVREELDQLRPQFSLEQLWSKLHLLRIPCLASTIQELRLSAPIRDVQLEAHIGFGLLGRVTFSESSSTYGSRAKFGASG